MDSLTRTYRVCLMSPASSTEQRHAIWQSALAEHTPAYSAPAWRLHQILTDPTARVYVALFDAPTQNPPLGADPLLAFGGHNEAKRRVRLDATDELLGFAITFVAKAGSVGDPTKRHSSGCLSVIAVEPGLQNKGIGTALYHACKAGLSEEILATLHLSTPAPAKGSIMLGSVFPRIFPGVPCGKLPQDRRVCEWFERKGWQFWAKTTIDLYQPFEPRGARGQPGFAALLQTSRDHGVTFRRARREDEGGTMQLQKEFSYATGWPDLYQHLFDTGNYDDMILAVQDGKIIGSAVAALPPAGADTATDPEYREKVRTHPAFGTQTWPATLGRRCGLLNCVGVAAASRHYGAGIGVVVAGTQSLVERGADGAFIDLVLMRGFYEKARNRA